jgi:RimJ/RimL family protein N-acetyltransferase
VTAIEHLELSGPASIETVALTDGTLVDVRPMRARDASDLVRFHHTLSTESTYLRFFSVHPELSADEVDRFTHVDHRDRDAIVARIDGAIVGVARFDRIDDSDRAEVAFVVSDAWQGHGLGTAMFEALASRARRAHIAWFVADTLPHNTKMLRVFRDAGLPVSSEFRGGVVHLTIELREGATP